MKRTATQGLEQPILAVDVILLTTVQSELTVLLHRRARPPYAGELSLPGVAVKAQETLADAAHRALVEKAGIAASSEVHLEQLATFDGLFRDPRGRTVGVAYLGLTSHVTVGGAQALWKPVSEVGPGSLPFDHDEILATATERLRGKIRYAGIARHLMPPAFRVDELRAVYESILGRRLNRSNFRSKLLKIGLLEQAGEAEPGRRGGRPAHLYRFAQDTPPNAKDFL